MKQFLLSEEQLLALNPMVDVNNYLFTEHPNIIMRCDVEAILDRKGLTESQKQEVWDRIRLRAEKELGSVADIIIQEEVGGK